MTKYRWNTYRFSLRDRKTEIADGLFVYNTVAFIGKNASGKTSFLDLLDCAYSILGNFSLEDKNYSAIL